MNSDTSATRHDPAHGNQAEAFLVMQQRVTDVLMDVLVGHTAVVSKLWVEMPREDGTSGRVQYNEDITAKLLPGLLEVLAMYVYPTSSEELYSAGVRDVTLRRMFAAAGLEEASVPSWSRPQDVYQELNKTFRDCLLPSAAEMKKPPSDRHLRHQQSSCVTARLEPMLTHHLDPKARRDCLAAHAHYAPRRVDKIKAAFGCDRFWTLTLMASAGGERGAVREGMRVALKGATGARRSTGIVLISEKYGPFLALI